MKAKDRAYLLIARKDGSSSTRRQRAFPDRAAVDRAIERWRGEGFNTWTLLGAFGGGVDGARALLKAWQDEPNPPNPAAQRFTATTAAHGPLAAMEQLLASIEEPRHPATDEPTNEARANRVADAIDQYARKHYGNEADRKEYETVAQDFLTDVCHWMGQYGVDPGETIQRAVSMYQEEVALEKGDPK